MIDYDSKLRTMDRSHFACASPLWHAFDMEMFTQFTSKHTGSYVSLRVGRCRWSKDVLILGGRLDLDLSLVIVVRRVAWACCLGMGLGLGLGLGLSALRLEGVVLYYLSRC